MLEPLVSQTCLPVICGTETVPAVVVVVVVVVDRFSIALFSALEQTHCARMGFNMSEIAAIFFFFSFL